MILSEIQAILENWSPKEIAWERDNVGLQIGSRNSTIRKVLVALDLTPEVVTEAIRKNVDLIITHHPVYFNPIKSIHLGTTIGDMTADLLKHHISVYSSHTNLDFTRNGVSFALASKIELDGIDFLLKNQTINKKIAVYVPHDYADIVIEAMSKAGAGIIGEYESCSFSSPGQGSFKGSNKSKPFIGKKGKLEKADELKVEMLVPQWHLAEAIQAMKKVHPYEEVAFDIYPLFNPSSNYGAGAIGNLPDFLNQSEFLKLVKRKLAVKILRYNNTNKRKIKRVAVCGGSGSDMIPAAIQAEADAFITADVSYHKYSENSGGLLLIDAGHFETEHPIVSVIVNFLKNELKNRNSKIQIFESKNGINPINYFIS